MLNIRIRLILLIYCVLLVSCATVQTYTIDDDTYSKDKEAAENFYFPTYLGPKIRIQVIRFGIPSDIVQKYPELADKRVGWGLNNRLVESFWETNMFEYVEEKEEIVKKMADQWVLSESGLISEDTAIEAGSLKAPEYLVYAEVYDFGVSHSEDIIGVRTQQRNTTIIGVQIRLVNVETGEFIPASAEGRSTTVGIGTWASVDIDFDQTTVGKASQDAINNALVKLMQRINR